MGSLNINSLFKHIDELRAQMANRPLDILAINESKTIRIKCFHCTDTQSFAETEISMVGVFVFIYAILYHIRYYTSSKTKISR